MNQQTTLKKSKNFFLSTLDISSEIFERATFGAKQIGITKHDRIGREGTRTTETVNQTPQSFLS
jgi:hypothetical protein